MGQINEKNFADLNNKKEYNEIKDVLTDGETILWEGSPKRSAYLLDVFLRALPVVIIWLLFDGAFIYFMLRFKNEIGNFIYLIIVFFILHLTPVWIWLFNIIRASLEHKNIQYAITDRKIIIRRGVVGIDFKLIHFNEISGVKCRVGLIDKLLKVGDIYIRSSIHSEVLNDIQNPYQIATKLNQIIVDIQTDMQYPNALRPDENQGYNTKYKR